jgi:sporulation protein YlmC with PRC-barrel domain
MAAETEFAIGAEAGCADGPCGKVSGVILDPDTRAVTHLVIDPGHRHGRSRLVPVDLVDSAAGALRLRCTLAEFGELEPAEETEMVEGWDANLGVDGMMTPMGTPQPLQAVVQDVVPLGETEVGSGEHVHALDGAIGRVRGFLVDPENHRVTHVLLQEGHIWGRKEVAIPVSAVTGVEDGIRLNMTKKQVEDLPPVG